MRAIYFILLACYLFYVAKTIPEKKGDNGFSLWLKGLFVLLSFTAAVSSFALAIFF